MGLCSLKLETLRDLYANELRCLFSAENQIIEALPKMADGATTPADSLQTILGENVAFDRKLSAIAESGVNLNAGNSGKAKTEFDVSIF